ncbi:MAG: response regulator transcription factor [Gammaproteobacteria bacterium]|nr:response regulator transcription factor [Gammaproteobacteria bacterium]
MRVLLVEDDELLGDGLQAGLTQFHYIVDWVKDGQAAINAITAEQFEIIILDLGLPKRSGIEVLKVIRSKGIITPVLILTAREGTENLVQGLDSGADDFLAKPFDLDELCARIRALQRRGTGGRAKPAIQFGSIVLDPAAHRVSKDGELITLSRREFVLLQLLLDHQGRVLSREHLTQNLYGWGGDVDSNALEVHVHNLRKKFGNKLITTIRGVGYVIEKQEE